MVFLLGLVKPSPFNTLTIKSVRLKNNKAIGILLSIAHITKLYQATASKDTD